MAEERQNNPNDPDAITQARERVAQAKETGTFTAPTADGTSAKPEATTDAEGAVVESPTDSATVQDPKPASAAESEEVLHLRQKVADLTKRIQDADGARGGELGKLRTQLADMNDKIAQLAEENKKLRETPHDDSIQAPANKEKVGDEWDADLGSALNGIPREIAESYGDELTRFIVTICRNVSAHSPVTAAKAPSPEAAAAQAEQYSFIDAVEALAPGFAAANGNAELNIPPDPRFAKFLDSPKDASNPGVSWRDDLEGKGPDEVAEGFRAFQALSAATTSTPPAPTIEGQEAINTTAAAPVAAGEEVYTIAEYNSLMEELQFGRGEMPMAEYAKKRERLKKLQEAARSGAMK